MSRFKFIAPIVLVLLLIGGGLTVAPQKTFAVGVGADCSVAACDAGLVCDSSTGSPICELSQGAASAQGNIAGGNNPTTPTDTNGAYGSIMTQILRLFAWLLGAAAVTLDYSAYYTVATMGTYVHGIAAIQTTWQILRDLGNIVLIFGFLAIGITMILGVEWYGSGKKMIPILLMAAIFLNFSLFISEAIIDTGNLFANEFYTQINGGHPVTLQTLNATGPSNEGISTTIMEKLGLQTIYGSAMDVNSKIFTGGNIWVIGFMGIILFIIATFVMFSLAFILVARFIVLIFLIVIAPIGFAGLAVPQLEGTAKKWWKYLIDQTMTAPVLLLLLYIALKVITDAQFLTGFGVNPNTGSWTSYLDGSATNIGNLASIILSFVVAMGLLMACTIVAKQMSAFGASWATKVASYPGRFAARAVVGRLGYGLENARSGKYGQGVRTLVVGGTRLATANLVGDYELKKYGQQMKGAKFGTIASTEERREFDKKDAVERDSIVRKRTATNAIGAAISGAKMGAFTPEQTNQTIQKNLALLSDKEIAELDGIKGGVEELVRNLSPQQFKSLMENKDLAEATKNKVKEARFKKVNADLQPYLAKAKAAQLIMDDTSIPKTDPRKIAAESDLKATERPIQDIVRPLPNSDLENAPSEFLENQHVRGALTESTRTDLIKSGKAGPSVIAKLKALDPTEKVKKAFDDGKRTGTSGTDAVTAMKGMKPEKIAKLPSEILKDTVVIESLTPAVMTKLTEELTDTDRNIIATHLLGYLPLQLPPHKIPGDPKALTMKNYLNNGFSGAIWGVTIP